MEFFFFVKPVTVSFELAVFPFQVHKLSCGGKIKNAIKSDARGETEHSNCER